MRHHNKPYCFHFSCHSAVLSLGFSVIMSIISTLLMSASSLFSHSLSHIAGTIQFPLWLLIIVFSDALSSHPCSQVREPCESHCSQYTDEEINQRSQLTQGNNLRQKQGTALFVFLSRSFKTSALWVRVVCKWLFSQEIIILFSPTVLQVKCGRWHEPNNIY